MTNSIDFYFDFISPYSYLAHKKIINLNQRNKFKSTFGRISKDARRQNFGEIYNKS